MKKIKLSKTLLIPSLGVLTLGTIAAVATSCGSSDNSSYVVVTANAESIFELTNYNNNPNLQYSTDGTSWNTYSEEISISQGQTLYLKGDNPNGWSHSKSTYSYLSISGNVMGLLDNGAKPGEQGDITAIPCDYCFYDLFRNSAGITSVSKDFLPSTNLAQDCYSRMFRGCTSLTQAPELPATELAGRCYYYMFYNCASLTTAKYSLKCPIN